MRRKGVLRALPALAALVVFPPIGLPSCETLQQDHNEQYFALGQNSEEVEIPYEKAVEFMLQHVPYDYHPDSGDPGSSEIFEFKTHVARDRALAAQESERVTFSFASKNRPHWMKPFLKGYGLRILLPGRAESHGRIALTGSALIGFDAAKAGTACVKFSGTAVHATQELSGNFTFDGGTGTAARLHATGLLRAVQRKPYTMDYMMELFIKQASLGKARSAPSSCGNAPAPPPPTQVSATFQGFALSSGPPASSATLTPDDGTISGSSCVAGGNLYAVFDYSGPTAAEYQTYTYITAGGASQQRSQKVALGRDAVLLYTSPPNGTYEAKVGIASTSGATLGGDTGFALAVARSC